MAVNLQTASIFDFTSDAALIEKIVGFVPDEADIKEYRQEAENVTRVIHLMDYAAEVNDKDLIKRLNEAFEADVNTYFNE